MSEHLTCLITGSLVMSVSYLSAGVNASISELLESTSSLEESDELENSSALRGGASEKTTREKHHFKKKLKTQAEVERKQ